MKIGVSSGLQAHFKQDNGPSRLGTDWAVSLDDGIAKQTIMVRTYNDESAHVSDQQMVDAIIKFILDKISCGWSPSDYKFEPGELTVSPDYYKNSNNVKLSNRPWWKFW